MPTLFEGEVDLKVKAGTQGGHRMRLRGKGVPHVRGLGAGDQFVHVGVRVPSSLSDRQRELLLEYAPSPHTRLPQPRACIPWTVGSLAPA